MKKWGSLVICILLCLSAGWIGSLAGSGPSRWYDSLHKPAWNPPPAVFGPVWTVLYILMAIAVWRIWLTPKSPARTLGLAAFALQLVLNTGWSWAFFGAKSPQLALYGIFLLLAAVAYVVVIFSKIDKPAAWILVPYCQWLTFATALNLAIYEMNKGSGNVQPVAVTTDGFDKATGAGLAELTS